MMKVTAIFDIGKTNKKCFLFDKKYQEVFRTYQQFKELVDEDGVPCDDLQGISRWVIDTLHDLLADERFDIQAVNFSTYGASFVHLDKEGNTLTPLYNYLKPCPPEILSSFYEKYGDELQIASETASPPLEMLNSGLQLYWLKHTQPEVFSQVKWSLHLPQYLSFLLTGVPLSEYTSIGCHTALWDYSKQDYHAWVYAEGLDKILAPIVDTHLSLNKWVNGKPLKIGVGIHDSSAALLPYIKADQKPFLLISTGTWSIALNPFNEAVLSTEDLQHDCLNFLRIDGKPVKAARLFLGHEYKQRVQQLHQHFGKDYGYHKTVRFDQNLCQTLQVDFRPRFHFEYIRSSRPQPAETSLNEFATFEEAFHQLMIELVAIQVEVAERAIDKTSITKLYVDGGFADNDLYIQLLADHFRHLKFRTTKTPLGSALGAALVISDQEIGKRFLKKRYAMQKQKPPLFIPKDQAEA